jgi:hypothetical protein
MGKDGAARGSLRAASLSPQTHPLLAERHWSHPVHTWIVRLVGPDVN